ncbi:MAG: hypothetical protein FWD52_09170 [Candidatus Bathyarchaeota archaeon]|nr:hypothetical protein [Candidatus Termitimicrobium sp.]MCL2643654.1 hypothetical protein [Candidatus Termiticorpusculum sp.]
MNGEVRIPHPLQFPREFVPHLLIHGKKYLQTTNHIHPSVPSMAKHFDDTAGKIDDKIWEKFG